MSRASESPRERAAGGSLSVPLYLAVVLGRRFNTYAPRNGVSTGGTPVQSGLGVAEYGDSRLIAVRIASDTVPV